MDININLETLKKWYYLANTPFYLFKHFREEPSIEKLSKDFNSEELINIYNDMISKINDNDEYIIYIYAIIIALTFKEDTIVKDFINRLDSCKLQWFDVIKYIYESNYVKTTLSETEGKKIVSSAQQKTTAENIDIKEKILTIIKTEVI